MTHRLWLARAISAVHSAVVLLFVVGWATPWREVLWAVVVGAVTVQMGWWLFGNRCVLTVLEARLRAGLEAAPLAPAPEHAPNFIADVATRFLGHRPSERALQLMTHGVMWGAFSIAAARLRLSG